MSSDEDVACICTHLEYCCPNKWVAAWWRNKEQPKAQTEGRACSPTRIQYEPIPKVRNTHATGKTRSRHTEVRQSACKHDAIRKQALLVSQHAGTYVGVFWTKPSSWCVYQDTQHFAEPSHVHQESVIWRLSVDCTRTTKQLCILTVRDIAMLCRGRELKFFQTVGEQRVGRQSRAKKNIVSLRIAPHRRLSLLLPNLYLLFVFLSCSQYSRR